MNTLVQSDFQALFDDAPVAYHELDSDGIVIAVNKAECALLGYSAEEMIGLPIWRFIANEEENDSRRALREKLNGLRALKPFWRTYVTRDHFYVTVEIRDSLIRNGVGEAVGIRSALIDVTARHAAEQAIAEKQELFSAILNSVPDGLVAIDPIGQVLSMNATAERMTGRAASQVVGADFERCIDLRNFRSEQWTKRTFTSVLPHCLIQPWTAVATLISADGASRDVVVRSSPMVTSRSEIHGVIFALCDPESFTVIDRIPVSRRNA